MDSRKLALLCRDLAENRKAENISVLDMTGVSSITDYFVLASGSSTPHLRAIAEEIEIRLKKDHGIPARAVDGSVDASWIVMDYFDVIVHVMRTDVRDHYNLEGLWGDAPRVKPTRRKAAAGPVAKAGSRTVPKPKPKAKGKAKAKAKGKAKVASKARPT